MGKKRIKDEGAIYDEQKKQLGGVWVTPTAKANLDAAATALGISRSELIERCGRQIKTFQLWQRLQELESEYHIRIQTPFDTGKPYFVGATPLGETGWNGRPDFEGEGQTLEAAIEALLQKIPENKD